MPALVSKGHLSRLSAVSVRACKLCREGAWPACKMDGELCAELGGGIGSAGTAPAPSAFGAVTGVPGWDGAEAPLGPVKSQRGTPGWYSAFSFSTPS